ncbi:MULTISPECIES: EthD domain-containing protein [Sphingobium]|uniref:EthD domain-containing protein n=1 Tax=Sphingobium sp. MI1205 TaxID=407020 RepID=UPI0007700A80|nr:EthD domain-containing protein [Sphingobium sp. MI1205]AMK19571.1 hypothetical protein K663_15965 [Sphingobium sp. MI1205]
MFRMLIFARMAPGLSRDEFIAAYEGGHITLVNELVKAGVHAPMETYRRQYLSRSNAMSSPNDDLNFDVVVDCAFAAEDDFRRTMENIQSDPKLAARLQEDFERFLDPSTLRYMAVDVHSGGGEAAGVSR